MRIIALGGKHSKLLAAVGADIKGKISLALYASAVIAAFRLPMVSIAIYVIVALIWLVPDQRIEKQLRSLQ
jgi:uncharacterized membrane protein